MIAHMMQVLLVVLLLAIFNFSVSWTGKSGQIVQTSTGKVRGIVSMSREHRPFYSWRGIPFAEPPLGDLRFANPIPRKPWKGVLNAFKYGDVCAQRMAGIVFGSEDCLSLNIYTPTESWDGNQKLPVMVFIHGGVFFFWSSQTFGPEYFMDADVVLVTINYRLGALGFLSTGDGLIRGNQGLKDQALALRWIKENIEGFGGDHGRITIFGESAGACSTHFHMMSPMSRGLFHQGISESGVALAPWAIKDDPLRQAKTFASVLNCPIDNTTVITSCLRTKSFYQLVRIHDMATMKVFYDFELPELDDFFFPVVESIEDEEAFITKHPLEMLKHGDFQKVPWMTGVNSAEGLFLSLPFALNPATRRSLDMNWEEETDVQLLLTTATSQAKSTAIRDFYLKNETLSSRDSLFPFVKMISDRFFFVPLYNAIQLHAKHAPTYAYHYAKRGPSAFNVLLKLNERISKPLAFPAAAARNWLDVNILRNSGRKHGAGHTDELIMLAPFINIYYVGKHHRDFRFSRDLVRLWASFATNHSTMNFRDLPFQPVNLTEEGNEPGLFQLDESPSVVQLGLKERAQFWDFVEGENFNSLRRL